MPSFSKECLGGFVGFQRFIGLQIKTSTFSKLFTSRSLTIHFISVEKAETFMAWLAKLFDRKRKVSTNPEYPKEQSHLGRRRRGDFGQAPAVAASRTPSAFMTLNSVESLGSPSSLNAR